MIVVLAGGVGAARFLQGVVQLALQVVVDLLFVTDGRKNLRPAVVQILMQFSLESADILDWNVVEIPVSAGVDNRHLLLNGQRNSGHDPSTLLTTTEVSPLSHSVQQGWQAEKL